MKTKNSLPEINNFNPLLTLDTNTSTIDDQEALNFLIEKTIHKLWKSILGQANSDFLQTIESFHGNEFAINAKQIFLDEYHQVANPPLPKGYNFLVNGILTEPNLIQKLVAHRISCKRRYGNWSGTGAGKTLAAIHASRHIDARSTLVVALNNTLPGWQKEILNAFPDSVVQIKGLGDEKDLCCQS